MLMFLLAAGPSTFSAEVPFAAVKSINPDWPRGPIQSNRRYAPVGDTVARTAGQTVRLVEEQFVKLVTEIHVKVAAHGAMHPQPREPVGIAIRVIGRTGGLITWDRRAAARDDLRRC